MNNIPFKRIQKLKALIARHQLKTVIQSRVYLIIYTQTKWKLNYRPFSQATITSTILYMTHAHQNSEWNKLIDTIWDHKSKWSWWKTIKWNLSYVKLFQNEAMYSIWGWAVKILFYQHLDVAKRKFLRGHQPLNSVRKRLCPISFE